MPGQQVFVPTVAAHLPSHGHCVQGVAGTYTAHLPWVQISLGAHVTPHAPQYGRFFVRSTQAVLPPTSHGVVSQIAWDRGACSAVLGIAEEIWTSHVVAIGQSAQTRTMGLLAIPVMCASLIAAAAVDRIVAKVKAPSVARGEPAGASVQSASRARPSDVPVSTTGPTVPQALERFQTSFSRPYGAILVTGPTGCCTRRRRRAMSSARSSG